MGIFECQLSIVKLSPARSRGSVSLGAWFGFAFLAAVLCELCGKEELNREERQGFAKDAKQVRGLALRSWRQSGASFAVRRTSPRRTPRIRKGRKAMVRSLALRSWGRSLRALR